MKLGILSDVHANIEALSASVDALSTLGIDEYYCLGDVVGYGASPNECCDIIRTLTKKTILGNHDAAVAGRMNYSYYYEAARQALDLHRSLITEENLQWLKDLPYKVSLEEHDIDFCHGSPLNLEKFEYIFSPEQARECLQIFDELANITLIGHSHLCKVFELHENGDVRELAAQSFQVNGDRKYIVSIGSVGQPRDWDPRASFVTFDTESRAFEFHRMEYDVESAANRIFESTLKNDFGHRLFIGV